MMGSGSELLSLLLEKYERSAHMGASSGRRVMAKGNDLERFVSSYEERERFLSALTELAAQNLVSVEFLPETDNKVVNRVFLNLNQDCLNEAYRISGRDNLSRNLDSIYSLLDGVDCDKEELSSFLDRMKEYIATKHRMPRFFSSDMVLNAKILKELVFLFHNDDEILERVLSRRLFGDSKESERYVRGPVVSILRSIASANGEDGNESDDEILLRYGLVRYPEIIEFCGNVKMNIRSEEFDYSSLKYGAYINSEDVKFINDISSSTARRVLFIENKANYVSALANRCNDEIIVYHGGFFSPVKGAFFRKLHACLSPSCTFHHWSDIDLGGFRIFMRLRKEIIPTLQPYRMDEKTLSEALDDAMPIENPSYLAKLQDLRGDTEFELFFPVIDLMLEKQVKLEQEALI